MRRRTLLIFAAGFAALMLLCSRFVPMTPLSPPTPEAERPPADPGEPEAVPVPPAEPPLVFRGLVLAAESGAPVEGARVVLAGDDTEWVCITDPHGGWTIEVPAGVYYGRSAHVTAKGRDEAWIRLRRETTRLPRRVIVPAWLDPLDAEIAGIVLGPDRRPIAGTELAVSSSPEEFFTNENGRFGPVAAGSGEQAVYLSPEGLPSWRVPTVLVAGERTDLTIVLPPPVFLTGLVVDEAGRPVADAEVFDNREGQEARTGPDGRFRLPLLNRSVACLEASKDDLFSSPEETWARAGSDVRIELKPGLPISGRVLPAEGQTLPIGLEVSAGGWRAPVGPDGSFTIGPVLFGENPEIEFGRHDLPPPFLLSDWRSYGRLPVGSEYRLPPHTVFEGKVVDATTGAPIAGARVNGSRAGPDGRFSVIAPPRRSTETLWIEAPGYVPASIRFREGEEAPVRLQPAREASVLVTDPAGRPVLGAVVTLKDREPSGFLELGVTNHVGVCSAPLPLGAGAHLAARHRLLGSGFVESPAGETRATIVLKHREPDVTVVVLDENGSPLPGAWLEQRSKRHPVDEAGRVRAWHGWSGEVSAEGRELARLEAWSHRPGETVEFQLAPSVPLTGRLLDDAGRPLPGVEVEIANREFRTDAEGRFVATALAAGRSYRVDFRPAGQGMTSWEVTVGGPEVELRLPARGRLRVDLNGPATGKPVFTVFRGAWEVDEEDLFRGSAHSSAAYVEVRSGRLEIDLPVGTASLRLRVPPGATRVYHDFEIRAGETTTVEYDFPSFGLISGRVLGADGGPVRWADILLAATAAWLAETDESGRFEIDPAELMEEPEEVAVGLYRLRVDGDEHAPLYTEPVDLATDRELTIRLKRHALLRMRLVGPDGRPARGYVEHLPPEGPPLFDQSFEEDTVGEFEFTPVGRVRVKAFRRGGETVVREIEVAEGRETTVTIRVP